MLAMPRGAQGAADTFAQGLQQPLPQPQGHGMFAPKKRGIGKLGMLGAMILAANNNPLGGALMQMRARQDENEAESEQYQRQLQDQWSMWERKQQWERENPAPRAPTQLERYMAAAGIDPVSEQGRKMMLQAAQNAANPLQGVRVTNPDGSEGIQFIRPGDGGGEDEWEYEDEGGAGQTTPRPFP